MKTNILISIFLTISILFVECKKDETVNPSNDQTQNLGKISLSDDQLKIIPYKENDVFKFKNATGDSMKFTVTSRSSYFSRMYENGGTNINSNFYDFEENRTVFSDECGHNYTITMNAPLPLAFLPICKGKIQMVLEFGIPDCKFPSVLKYYEVFLVDTITFEYLNQNANVQLYDSLDIINKKFYTVFKLKNTNVPSDTLTYDYVVSMFYNKNKGIVGLETKKGNKWYLE